MRSVQLGLALGLLVAVTLQLVALPDWMRLARPYWIPLMLSYWALSEPRAASLLGAFIAGLAVDVAFAAPLGQHALASVIVVYLIHRLRPIFILFETWQAALALIPIWALHAFLLFWVDGVTGHSADPWLRWAPVASTALVWPPLHLLMHSLLRERTDEE